MGVVTASFNSKHACDTPFGLTVGRLCPGQSSWVCCVQRRRKPLLPCLLPCCWKNFLLLRPCDSRVRQCQPPCGHPLPVHTSSGRYPLRGAGCEGRSQLFRPCCVSLPCVSRQTSLLLRPCDLCVRQC